MASSSNVKQSKTTKSTGDKELFVWGIQHGELIDYKQEESILKDKKIKALAAGESRVLVLAEKKVYSFEISDFIAIDFKPQVQGIACGGTSCFLISNGTAYGWGKNDKGQLGVGDTISREQPTQLVGLDSVKIDTISAGINHTGAIGTNGELFLWGAATCGQLGFDSDESSVPTPHPVLNWEGTTTSSGHVRPQAAVLSLGAEFTIVATTNGLLWYCGHCSDIIKSAAPGEEKKSMMHSISLLAKEGHSARKLAAAENFLLVVTRGGRTFVGGSSRDGQLGIAERFKTSFPREMIKFRKFKIRHISASSTHAAAISEYGDLYTWGATDSSDGVHIGCKGHSSPESVHVPLQVRRLTNYKALRVACGIDITATLAESLPKEAPLNPYVTALSPDEYKAKSAALKAEVERDRRAARLRQYNFPAIVITTLGIILAYFYAAYFA